MAWSIYQFYATDETGQVLPGAVVTVRDSLLALAVIASDSAGTPLANPFSADDAGKALFYAQTGKYRIEVTYGGATFAYDDVPIGSARAADIGDAPHEVRLNESNDDRFVTRTQEPIIVTADTFALSAWAGRVVRVTAAAMVMVPEDFPVGFTFDVQRATTDTVGFLLDNLDVFEPSFGDGTGVTTVVINEVNGWASVMKTEAGKIAVVGQIEDATP